MCMIEYVENVNTVYYTEHTTRIYNDSIIGLLFTSVSSSVRKVYAMPDLLCV